MVLNDDEDYIKYCENYLAFKLFDKISWKYNFKDSLIIGDYGWGKTNKNLPKHVWEAM